MISSKQRVIIMKCMKYLSKVAVMSLVFSSLALHGYSSATHYFSPIEIGSLTVRSLNANKVTSSNGEQSEKNADAGSQSDSKKSKNCKDVITLEKPSGLPRFLRTITGDRKLRPKDKVPAFTLPKIDGEEVSLYDVLEENDYVVIDFWATACGPCIAKFPKWKNIYSIYNEHGLEIVSICTDLTQEDWEESSQEHQLPWIDVGEIEEEYLGGPTSKAFRLRGLPRSYLVDSKGCILHTHIFPIELEKFLKTEYADELKEIETKPP